eukprot:6462822-Heterocapsa_arctica.AAC.1
MIGRPYRCTRTGVHDNGVLHKNKWASTSNVIQAQSWTLKLSICVKCSAFCEESNGHSEDA